MTAQIAETLHFEGREVSMCTEPLDRYFELAGIKPEFSINCTALWRGYVGEWEIQDGRLYLLALDGILQSGAAASVEAIFPGYPDRVFAHWYSGNIRLPEGKLLKYVHGGYGSTYERDRIVNINKGVLVSIDLKINGTAPESDRAREGYTVQAMTTFPHAVPGEGAES